MKLKGIKKRLIFQQITVIFITVLIFQTLFIVGIRKYYYGNIAQTLRDRVTVSAEFYNKYGSYDPFEYRAKYLLENSSSDQYAEVQIVDINGKVIESSSGFYSNQCIDEEDFLKAKNGEVALWKGKHKQTGESIMTVSAPLKRWDRIEGVLRYVTSVEDVDKLITRLTMQIIVMGIGVLVLVFILSLFLAKSIIQPIKKVTRAASKMAVGDFTVHAQKVYEDEIGELADTLNYMAEEIVKSNRIKNDFISSISHEIRTPLTSIKGWSETVLTGGLEDKQESLEGLAIISKETDRLIELVEELLDFSRIQSNRMTIRRDEVNLLNLIRETVHQFHFKFESKQISFVSKLPDQLSMINGDYNRLKQVLVNILDNAMKFTPVGGEVIISVKENREKICLTIQDTGNGISEEDLQKVKEKFYKGSNKLAGSGLGLSISDEIIRLHQGKLNIESREGIGTKVDIYIPIELSQKYLSPKDFCDKIEI